VQIRSSAKEEIAPMPKLRPFQALTNFGSVIATIVTIVTANWPVALSAVIGLGTAFTGGLRGAALNPVTYVGVGTFLAVLWTIIGILVLVDRSKPRLVRSAVDYRYGLNFEGIQRNYLSATDSIPNAGALQLGINIRNYSLGPILCQLEDIDIRIGSRASPKFNKAEFAGGLMFRGAGRTIQPGAFAAEDLKEFYGTDLEGAIDFSIVYGHPDGAPERRLRMTLKLYLNFAEDGSRVGYSDNIIAEYDEPV
jgi:hypothetical protein